MPDELRDLIARHVRERVRLRLGPNALGMAALGESVMLSGVEADLVGQAAVDALAGAGLVVVSAELLDDLADPDPCWFDHHGGCQAHGFLSLEPGERCPHAVARELLAALPERTDRG